MAHRQLREKLEALKVPNPFLLAHLERLTGQPVEYKVRQGDWRAMLDRPEDHALRVIRVVNRRDALLGTYR